MAMVKVRDGDSGHRFADPDLAVCSWRKGNSWWRTRPSLYKTHSGRYWQHSPSDPFYTEFLSPRDAAMWLLERGYDVPKDLEFQLKVLVEI